MDGENPALADQFIKMVLGSAGQKILAAHGFLPLAVNE
jgi:ABC-type molybdate transport system substrate-binding protein